MAGVGRATGGWLRQVRGLFGLGTVGGWSDGQLLDAFVSRRGGAGSEAAFEELMHRHGPMVLHICRRVLRDPEDAEDAFQATFLVLAHRPDRSGGETRWRAGSSASHNGSPPRPGFAPRGDAPASDTSPSKRPRLTGPPRARKSRRP